MRMFKGQAGSTADEWQFPQAPAFAASGIRSSSIVSITWDKDIITGKYLFKNFRGICIMIIRSFMLIFVFSKIIFI